MKGAYGISMGALSEPIEQQLQRQGFTLGAAAERLEQLTRGVTMLRIHSILTEAESDRARKRLMKEIELAARPLPTTEVPE